MLKTASFHPKLSSRMTSLTFRGADVFSDSSCRRFERAAILCGALQNANGAYSISFAFLPDLANTSNMLIRAIVMTGDTANTLENVR